MRHSWKKLLVAVFVLLLVATGCSSGTSGGDGGSGDGKVNLRVLVWGNGPAELKGEEEIYAQFMEDHPEINVDLVSAPYDKVMEKFVSMTAGGDQPDVIWMQPIYFAEFAEKGMFMDLGPMLEEEGLTADDWLPKAFEMGQYDDTQYALPRDIITHHIVYNKDMFDAAGVEYPQADWTWDDLLEKAQQLTIEEGDRTSQYGFSSYYWKEALYQNGTVPFNRDGTEVLIDSPEAIEAIEWVADLSLEHGVAPTPTENQGMGDLFLAGKAAMAFAGPWNWRAYDEEGKFAWDIQEVPAGQAGNKSELLGLPVSIGADTENPEAAWTLLKWLTHGGGQDIQSDIVGAYPTVPRAQENFSNGTYAPDNVEAVHIAMEENTVLPPLFVKQAEVENMIQPVMDQIMAGKVTPAEALPELADKMRAELGIE
ncbi:ABC transporter substrate-binding protein [Aureibacillus halotolerans]|uniref:Carbohydrate ABC transporter substrate-binding protein (CUT1 family) n=1 Tax=Aureibacillus halotolerans TaxID=1508390 RepID=A0A4V3D5M4_9BACI|nr:sugar ABC transporter substrate-binding protein [Aureibacillus halotolerans]TDQ40687.1 carbohydrate ABC transporter substrate-binding protein (CUT1 family) [Aureibacillus halotolerans]